MGIEFERSYEEISSSIPDIGLLIVTANEIETFHVKEVLQPIPPMKEVLKVPHRSHTYFIGTFGQYKACHVQCATMGAVRAGAAITTVMQAIESWKPKVVVMIGVAMGVNEAKQNIGDVLISESIIAYEPAKFGPAGTIHRHETSNAGQLLVNRFKNETSWCQEIGANCFARITPGPILSGEKLIDNLEHRNDLLKAFPNAIGAEMEGAGLYSACRSMGVHEWILVKAICDYGDGHKSHDKDKRQHLAAQCATSLCLTVFNSRIGFADAGLIPIPAKKSDDGEDFDKKTVVSMRQEEIVTIMEENNGHKENQPSDLQLTVAAFLELPSIQKATVIEEVGYPLSELAELSPHEIDLQFFRYVKEHNLIQSLRAAINKVK